MKRTGTWLLILLLARVGQAQLQVVPESRPQAVFGGRDQEIAVQFRNVGAQLREFDLRLVLLQTSTATAARSSEWSWKKLLVLPGQTVLEVANVPFPAVRAETRFLLQWIEGASNLVGRIEVLVYPTNLLQELKTLGMEGVATMGVFDPENQLKPLLRAVAVEFLDLETVGFESFAGKLAIVGTVTSGRPLRGGLKAQIEVLAKRGLAIVWIMPPLEGNWEMQPSFYVVRHGTGCVVVAQAETVSHLAENPQAQLNLLHFARLALRPEPPQLPPLTP
jgi:hypothetical protein